MSGNIEVRVPACACCASRVRTHAYGMLLTKRTRTAPQRLAARAAEQPEQSELLFDIVRAEVADGTAAGSSSCTKGLLWLKRFLEFTMRLLERLARDEQMELGTAASAAYAATLRPFHGYLTCALFSVIMRAAPYRATFERALASRGAAPLGDAPAEPDAEALRAGMAQFVDKFAPLLARIHVFLADIGQDDPTPV